MLYLLGAGGHAKVIVEITEELEMPIGGVLDSNKNIKELLGYPVFCEEDKHFDISKLIIAIGDNSTRKRLVAKYADHNFISLIHPRAFFSKRVKIGVGSVIMSGVSVNASVSIGNHVIINTNASVNHDCVIDDYAHISPNVALAGGVIVEEGAHVGIGACVIQGITIGKWSVVGAGAVVIRDIPDYAVVVGNPGKIIKYNYCSTI